MIKLDQDTVSVLSDHRARAQRRCAELGTTLDDAFVFSCTPDHRRHCDPDVITHRYSKMAADVGIDTHLHALRHYNATELLYGGSIYRADSATAAEQPRSRATRPG
ncbi:MAG: hypothetical protein ACRDQU_11890 [Pseudonocardiaceae bacterium]